jgi:tetratricopeptide (TPR) repeat protein
LRSFSSNKNLWLDAAAKLSSDAAPGAYRILLSRGIIHLGEGRLDLARLDMETIIRQKPHFDGGHYGLAQILVRENLLDEALAATDQAIKYAPNRPDLVAYKARILLLQGKTIAAKELWDSLSDSQDLATQLGRSEALKALKEQEAVGINYSSSTRED